MDFNDYYKVGDYPKALEKLRKDISPEDDQESYLSTAISNGVFLALHSDDLELLSGWYDKFSKIINHPVTYSCLTRYNFVLIRYCLGKVGPKSFVILLNKFLNDDNFMKTLINEEVDSNTVILTKSPFMFKKIDNYPTIMALRDTINNLISQGEQISISSKLTNQLDDYISNKLPKN